MSEIEKIQRYIEKTGFEDTRYSMNYHEASTLARRAKEEPFEMIALAFDYGCAKGYRAGKKGATV